MPLLSQSFVQGRKVNRHFADKAHSEQFGDSQVGNTIDDHQVGKIVVQKLL